MLDFSVASVLVCALKLSANDSVVEIRMFRTYPFSLEIYIDFVSVLAAFFLLVFVFLRPELFYSCQHFTSISFLARARSLSLSRRRVRPSPTPLAWPSPLYALNAINAIKHYKIVIVRLVVWCSREVISTLWNHVPLEWNKPLIKTEDHEKQVFCD